MSKLLSTIFIISICTSYSQNIDTVNTYFELRTYNGSSDSVYINHDRYFGLFIKGDCLNEDFGTTLLTSNGCWERIANNYKPRFWEIGGKSPDNQIKTVTHEIDAINSAAWAAFSNGGDTIEIDGFYSIDKAVNLFTKNTYLGLSDSSGFIRISPPKTILTDTAKVSDSKITVESTIGFRTFQKINIVNSFEYDSLAKHVSYTASVSSFAGPNTILLSGRKIQKEMYPGDSVSLFFSMMKPRFSSLDSVIINNLIFHGNRDDYTLNYDWRINTTISLPTTNYSLIEGCRFYEIPNENIFLCGVTLKNCSGNGFNGSVLHFSCNTDDRFTEITYNKFKETNVIGDSIMEHSEAAMTFSAKVRNLRVAYNRIENINENGIGIFQNDDFSNEITDNLFNAEKNIVGFSPFYHVLDSNVIYNNKRLSSSESNKSDSSCWKQIPKPLGRMICNASTTFESPLFQGDSILVIIDTILVRNTNQNFIKEIIPIVNNEYFRIIDISINTPILSSYHQWEYTSSDNQPRLIFDNGVNENTLPNSNWGYELCGKNGGCSSVKILFELINEAPVTQQVICPLLGIKTVFDGGTKNWDREVCCDNDSIIFDQNLLGKPYIHGDKVLNVQSNIVLVSPNPVEGYLHLHNFHFKNQPFLIANSVGQIVKKGLINNKIYVGELKAGIYVINVSNDEKTTRLKFVKR